MAKGQEAKKEIINKLLKTFDGSFLYNDGKEVRIPMQEDGADIQIKITLTCAKTNVEAGDENALPGESKTTIKKGEFNFENDKPQIVEPTEEEISSVNDLISKLNL